MQNPEPNIVKEKLNQAVEVLNEENVDLWIVLARESDIMGDPILPLVVGTSVTWESSFLISRDGDHAAIVGTGDVQNIKQTGAWDNVIGYVQGFSQPLIAELERRDPNAIALNYSMSDSSADGLPHGFYLLLEQVLSPTPFWERVRSADPIPGKVRGRKSPTELARIKAAVRTTERIWEATQRFIRPGVSEIDIADFMHGQVEERQLTTSWDWNHCPGVTVGPDSPIGHCAPLDLKVEPGQLVSIDFGVLEEDYASDMQRTYYVLGKDETEPPAEVLRHFDVIDRCIQAAASALKPGARGWEVDAAARKVLEDEGMPSWDYALGHQVGRAAHDGGTTLGPLWERYGDRPKRIIGEGEVYALEIGVSVPGYGRVNLEENLVVTADGSEFLAAPQRELIVLKP